MLCWTLLPLKWTDMTQKKAPSFTFNSLYIRPKQTVRPGALLGDIVPSDAVLWVHVAAEGSTAICSGHVWFKPVSGGTFCYISLGRETKCLAATRGKKKKLTKRKLKCHVESVIWFDVEPCSGIWSDHWRRRWFGEFYRIKLNRSMNEWLYLMAPLTKCSYCLSSPSFSPISLTMLTCSNGPYKGWCMLFGTVKVEFLLYC